MFDRQVRPIAPFAPRTQVVSNPGIADQSQCQIGMGGTVSALTMRNHFLVRTDVVFVVHLSQFVGRLEESFLVQILRPFQMDGSRIAPPRAARTIFPCILRRSSIDDDGIGD